MTNRHNYIMVSKRLFHAESNKLYDEETEQLSEDLANISGEVVDLTKTASNVNGISLFTDETQTEYKSIYEYLQEISEIYDELGAKQKQELMEKLFGKQRASVGSAILSNFEAAEKAMTTMQDSTGSAEKEMETIAQSLTFKLNNLKETGTGIIQDIFKKEEIGSTVDGLTSILTVIGNIIDKVGVLPTLMTGISAALSFKNIGIPQAIGSISKFKGLTAMTFDTGFATSLSNDETALRNYKAAVASGIDQTKAFETHMTGASDAAMSYAQNVGASGMAVSDFVIQQKATQVSVIAQNKSLSTAKSLILEYNNNCKNTGLTQAQFTQAVSQSNAGLGKYLSGLNGAKGSWYGYIASLVGAKVATIALQAATMALNMVLTMGVSTAVSALISAVGKLIVTSSELDEKVSEITQKFNEQKTTLQDNKATLNEISGRYEELSKGVNALGENVSLTSSEYEEYQGIVSTIADMFPTLVQGYNSQGTAILSCKGNVEELTNAYNELVIAQNSAVISNGNDIWKDFKNKQKDLNRTNWNYTEMTTKSYEALKAGLSSENIDEWALKYISDAVNDGYNKSNRTQIAKALENAGLERGTFENNYNFILRNLKSNPAIAKAIIADFETQFDSAIEGVKSYAEASLSTALTDSNLNFGIQSLLESSFNSLGYDFYSQFDTSEQLSNYINNVISEFNNLGNENGKTLIAFLDIQTQYNNGECSKEEYLSALNDAQSIFEGLSDDTQKQFEVIFDFDVPEEETTKALETIEDKVKSVKDSFTKSITSKNSNPQPDKVYRNQIEDFNKWVDSLSDEDKELVYQIGVKADDTSLWTLTKWQSELIRVKTGAVESEEALQKFYDTLNNTSEGSFTDSLNGYKEQLDSFKDYLDKIDLGTITDDEKLNLALAYPELAPYINDTDSLRNAIQTLIDTTNGGIDTLIEEQIRDLGIEGTSAAEALRTLGELAKSDNFRFDIDSETQKFNNLYLAMKESVSATGITADSMAKVNAMFSELEGYDPSKLFERTENGIHMNTTALRELTSEYEKQKKTDVDSKIKSKQEEYAKLTEQINKTSDAEERLRLLNQRDKIVDELNAVADLATQYEGLTSTYNKWIQAQSSGNERDMYENILSGKSTIEDLISRGWEGSDVVRNYVDLLSSADLNTATVDEVMMAWDNLGKTIGNSGYSIWDFFTTDGNGKSTSEGVYRFFDTVKSELGEAYAWIDEETGKFNFDFGLGKDAEVAEKFGMDVEALQSILRAANDGNFEIHLDNAYSSLSELNSNATNALETLKALERDGKIDFKVSDINLDFSTVKEAEIEIEKAQKILDKFRDKDGKVDLSIEGAEEAEILLFNFIKQKQELSQPEIMSIDTTAISTVDSELGNAIELLQQFHELSNQLDAEITMGVTDTTNTQQQIQDVANKLNTIPDDTKVKLGLDDFEFTTALNNIQATEIDINAGINPDDILTIQGSIDSIKAKDIEMMTNSSEIMSEMQAMDRFKFKGKTIPITANTMAAMVQLQNIKNQIDTLPTSKTITVRTNNITVNSTSNADYNMKKPTFAQGTAHAVGTAFVKGDWGTKGSGMALGGELGEELVVRNGKFFTIGEDGAGFFNYQPNDIIFNAEQTYQIFKYGKIKSGKKRGEVFVNGTAFSSGTGGTYRPNFNSNNGGGSSSGGSSSGNSSNSGNSSSKTPSSSSSTSDTTEEFKEVIDWIEIAIDRIERAISTLDLKAQSIYRSWSSRNDNLRNEITRVSEEITLQQKAYDRYLQEADSIGLSEEWAEKVRNGKIDIETITDEYLNDKINQYREWYDKAIDCRDAVEELTETVSELYETAFENVSARFDGIINTIEHETSMIEEFINRTEEKGYITSVKYYEALIGNERNNIQELEKEKSELILTMQTAVDSGAITENSESWHEMISEINDVALAIEEANTEVIKFGNSIRDIQWEIFDLLEERISFITQESDFLISLMENDKLYDDRGQLTEQGMSTMGLHGTNYNVYMVQADKYAQEMLNIDKELADDPYNQDLFERRQELLELQQEMILAANDEKEAIRDMVQEGIELELDSLQKLIDEYENALDAEKDLYDYQKKLSSQTKNIANLEKQLSAYTNDTSEETKAKVQQLKVSLQEARENLQETQYDKYVSDQKKLLDELYNEYETILNQRLDDLDTLIRDMIQDINDNSDTINATLISEAKSVGYKLSNNMLNIWNSSSGTNQILTTYGNKFINSMTSINNTVNSIGVNIQNMIGQLNKLANTDIDAISNSYQDVNENINSMPDIIEKPVVFETPDDNKSNVTKSDLDIKIGGKINAGNAKIYSYIGAGGIEQYYKSDPIYTVLSEKDGYIQVRHHKLSNGISGWFKKSDVNAYKNGVYNLKQDELAWTQENGVAESIIRRSDGAVLTPLGSGDSVLNGNATANLFDFANSPADFIYNSLFGSKNFGNFSKVSNSSNNTSVNFENVNFNLPNVKNYDEFMHTLQHDKKFETMVRAMTTDRIFGGSSLKKYHL